MGKEFRRSLSVSLGGSWSEDLLKSFEKRKTENSANTAQAEVFAMQIIDSGEKSCNIRNNMLKDKMIFNSPTPSPPKYFYGERRWKKIDYGNDKKKTNYREEMCSKKIIG